MRWKRPQHGATRIRRKFSWLPTVTWDRMYVIWLEHFYVVERYTYEWDERLRTLDIEDARNFIREHYQTSGEI
jgi:hypothetical protein